MHILVTPQCLISKVKEQLMLNDLNVDGYTTMETILEDVFNVILHNHSYGILEAMEEVQNCLSLKVSLQEKCFFTSSTF